jgi:hypothetical protein
VRQQRNRHRSTDAPPDVRLSPAPVQGLLCGKRASSDLNPRAIENVARKILPPSLAHALTPAKLMGVIGNSALILRKHANDRGCMPGQSRLGQMIQTIGSAVSVIFETEDAADAEIEEMWRQSQLQSREEGRPNHARKFFDLDCDEREGIVALHPPFAKLYRAMVTAVHQMEGVEHGVAPKKVRARVQSTAALCATTPAP